MRIGYINGCGKTKTGEIKEGMTMTEVYTSKYSKYKYAAYLAIKKNLKEGDTIDCYFYSTHLNGLLRDDAKYPLSSVYNRNPVNAAQLVKKLSKEELEEYINRNCAILRQYDILYLFLCKEHRNVFEKLFKPHLGNTLLLSFRDYMNWAGYGAIGYPKGKAIPYGVWVHITYAHSSRIHLYYNRLSKYKMFMWDWIYVKEEENGQN